MSDEPTNFKVTDRRLFNPDGTPRDIAPEQQPAPKPKPAVEPTASTAANSKVEPQPAKHPPQASPPAAASPSAATPGPSSDTGVEEEELYGADDPAGFVNFVMSIASNAASSLGMMEHPVTHQRDVDLELAKHWIDVLGMLQKKTRNNLALQEEKILEGLLADLRMQYVSLTNSAAPATPRAFSGRDIVGG